LAVNRCAERGDFTLHAANVAPDTNDGLCHPLNLVVEGGKLGTHVAKVNVKRRLSGLQFFQPLPNHF